jgi:hypothetical protein
VAIVSTSLGFSMISDRSTADKINTLMHEFSARLDTSLLEVMDSCPDSEFKEYRFAIGKIMGDMLLDVMNPIYKQHPSLKPKELQQP